ncbi:C1 family peptidase [Desulfobacter latus]|uniref:Fibronectin type-III domain-containing protein n=1 Tax=Desulfobacter latus TaxID=2292 RepID=A0A850SWP0_9BACT|nr:C1 family peptidase [Desulfobacter latus]NWH03823.1 hypothetical protein [Desulfobacter latus]
MNFRHKSPMLIVLFAVLLVFGSAWGDQVDERIRQLNLELKAQGESWTAGRTNMSDMSPEQRRALLGGPDEPQIIDTGAVEKTPDGAYIGGAFPASSFDWRNRSGTNWMTPVTNQMCGDCWAHATLGSMEVRLRYQKGGTYGYQLPINLSERYAVTCSPHASCSAWNIPGLLSFIESDGVPDEECLPYNSSLDCSDRCSNWSHRVYKVTNYGTYYGPGSTFRDQVANSVYYYGPIPVWMKVYDDFWDYSGGIYTRTSSVEEGGHFVNIVGWGTSGGVDYWICKNSWGTGWGVNGYFYIRRGTNESRIEEAAYWLTPQNLPNLNDSTPTGWDYPIVPRGNNTATTTNATVTSTLPGNSNATYWNVNWKNEGTVKARDNVTHLSVDDIYTYWFSLSYQPAGYDSRHVNSGPSTVRGGRHTICQNTMDYDNRVWEYDENDNTYCKQFVWSPYSLSDNVPVTRSSAPPKRNTLGYSYYNCDGFSFDVQSTHPTDWWSAVGILPYSSSADYDVRLHDIGTYTGSEGGFGSYLEYSSYGGSASDFVIVNDNQAAHGTYYAGVLNYNEGSGAFRIEEDASEKIFDGTNGPYSKISSNVLDIYEYYASSAGTYRFKLDQTAGTCDLGMTLYDDDTTTASKSDYMSGGYANSNGDGQDEYMDVTIPDAGFHGLAVWKADAGDYNKTTTYKLQAGKCATPGTPSTPSPTDGAVNVPVTADLDWANSSFTLYYDVWFKKSTDASYTKLGEPETSAWALGTLDQGTTYQWAVRSNNICGSASSYVYWSFTTVDTTPPTPDPMTWSVIPYELDTSEIKMTATTASDPSTPVSYYFDFTSSPTGGTGGSDSGWTTSTSYTDSGLQANHQYEYTVAAKDAQGNMTAYSTSSREYTDIETPAGIVFGTITTTSIQARSSNTPSNLSSGSSGLLVENTTEGTSSGWKQNNNLWTSGSLSPNQKYTFRAMARNGDGNQTPWSGSASCYTQAKAPEAMAFSNITQTSIQANWSANGNPAGTAYYCENLTQGTNSGWITATSWNSTGLDCGKSYTFRVRARNEDAIETTLVSLGSATTLPCADACEGNFDGDNDVDVSDFAVFAADYGRTDCDTGDLCEGNFDGDNDVDVSDFAVFAADYGRTDCP